MTDTKHAGGRKPTGTVVPLPDGRLQGIITKHGKRKRLPPFPLGTSRAMAEERTAARAQKAAAEPRPKAEPVVASDDTDTPMGRWRAAWTADRVAKGYTTTKDNTSHFRLHIAPSIGTKHVKDWTRDDLRKLSRDLDTKVVAREMAWKMAINVWGTATKMCADASMILPRACAGRKGEWRRACNSSTRRSSSRS
jgi:hypothetical protein